MKSTHTHRGTCQVCGARQAVDNASKFIAKHGYQVAGWGFFNGVCSGSGHLPAELDLTIAQATIVALTSYEADQTRLQGLYASHDLMAYTITKQVWNHQGGKHASGAYESKELPIFGCDQALFDLVHNREAASHGSAASRARGHIEFIGESILPRFGKALYKAAKKVAPRQFAVGDQVRLAGRPFRIIARRYGGFKQTEYWKGEFTDEKGGGAVTSVRILRMQN